MQLGLCTCKQGIGGALCSHQAAVSKHYHLHSINSVINLFPEKQKELATVALGSKAEQEKVTMYLFIRKRMKASYITYHQKVMTAVQISLAMLGRW